MIDQEHRAQEQQINNRRRQQVAQADNFTSVGLLNVECQNCGALRFSKETEGLFVQKAMMFS